MLCRVVGLCNQQKNQHGVLVETLAGAALPISHPCNCKGDCDDSGAARWEDGDPHRVVALGAVVPAVIKGDDHALCIGVGNLHPGVGGSNNLAAIQGFNLDNGVFQAGWLRFGAWLPEDHETCEVAERALSDVARAEQGSESFRFLGGCHFPIFESLGEDALFNRLATVDARLSTCNRRPKGEEEEGRQGENEVAECQCFHGCIPWLETSRK